MKIEKINDNQIKCTLNKSDLVSRQIKLSELAYGTEKAKNLFRDMMQQASSEFGFEAEDIPLMIEAIPVSGDCIVLLITKVEDPEELDTRFSRFAPSPDDIEETDGDGSYTHSTPELLDMFSHIKNELKAVDKNGDNFIPLPQALSKSKSITIKESKKEPAKESVENQNKNIVKIFSFKDIYTIVSVSTILQDMYNGNNTLYKASSSQKYYLVVTKSNHSIEDFNKVCNILLEYGTLERGAAANEAFYKEHYTKIISKKALQKLLLVQ
ncbi:MAG: adaptor protein MecA [Clostridiales bacterium]|nr:adaptor protein MecA [Clostridiales bacterium]